MVTTQNLSGKEIPQRLPTKDYMIKRKFINILTTIKKNRKKIKK